MKVVILAGGKGTRLSEETQAKPKPMVHIGGRPILWHIMKSYSSYGFNEFVVAVGHLGYVIKEYFANYFLHMSDVTFDMKSNKIEVHRKKAEPWRVTLVDTGEETMTGGRLRRVKPYLDGPFHFTYGDGLADVDLKKLSAFHKKGKRLATVTAVQAPGRFGSLGIHDDKVANFREKPKGDGNWINGGFFILEPKALDGIKDDASVWEREPMETLAKQGQLGAFKHDGFWQPMDTLRDRNLLEELWASDTAPWKTW